MNQKVLKKLKFSITKEEVNAIISGEPMAVERVLRVTQGKIANYLSSNKNLETNQPISKDKYGIK